MSYTFGTYDSKKRALDAMRSQNQESINQYSTDRFFREGGNVASAWSIKDKSLIASGIRSVAQKTADAESAEIDEFENSDNLSMEFDGQTYEAKDADEKSAIIENLRDTSQGKLENARRRAREFVSGDAVRYETTKEEKEAIEASLSEKQAPYMQEAERIERFSRVGRMSYDLRDNQKDLVYGSERERIESANRQRVSQIESNRMEQPEEPLVPLQNKREQMEAEANVGGFARIETAKEAFAERIRQRVAQNEDLRTRANDRSFESMIEPAEQRRAKMARETATRELAVDNRTIGIDTRRISEEFNMDFAEMARELEAALASQLGTVGKNLALEYTGSIEVEMRNMPPNINTQVLEETIKRLQQQLTQLKSQVDNQQRTSEGKPAVVR